MRATIRRFHNPDADLETYAPEDMGILVQIMAGPEGGTGEESFDVVVCSPRWLGRWVGEGGPLIGRHYLIVEGWDASRIRRHLTNAVEAEEAPTWPKLALRIGRIGKWEFEEGLDFGNGHESG